MIQIGPEIMGALDWDIEHGNCTKEEAQEILDRIIDEQLIAQLKMEIKYGKET